MQGPTVAGLDGCRRGWVLAVLGQDGATGGGGLTVSVAAGFAEAMATAVAAGAVVVGADIPIGLPVDGVRPADGAARRLLGPRRASVFPTPCRAVLGAVDYPDALVQSRAFSGRGLSKQAWNLITKMREVDEWVRPEHETLLHEVHPELAFARLHGSPLPEAKRSARGAELRRALLATALDPCSDGPSGEVPAGTAALRAALAVTGAGVAADDVLDAVAVALSARAIAAGRGTILGDGRRDERGLVMRICF